MKSPLNLERLERREVPSVTQVAGLLDVSFNDRSVHAVTFTPGQAAGQVVLSIDQQAPQTFSAVTSLSFEGNGFGGYGNQSGDYVNNLTSIASSFLDSGYGARLLSSAAGSSIVALGDHASVQDFAANCTFDLEGNASEGFMGRNASITIGPGANVVAYNTAGSKSFVVKAHNGRDFLMVNAASTINDATPGQDVIGRFFPSTAPVNSGQLSISNGTVFYAADNKAANYFHTYLDCYNLVIDYKNAAGSFEQVVDSRTIKMIIAFGGTAQNLTAINDTGIASAEYGGTGTQNVLVGGYGAFDLEKAIGGGQITSRAYGENDVYGVSTGAGTAALSVPATATINYAHEFKPGQDTFAGFRVGRDVWLGPTPTPPASAILPPLDDALVVAILEGLHA